MGQAPSSGFIAVHLDMSTVPTLLALPEASAEYQLLVGRSAIVAVVPRRVARVVRIEVRCALVADDLDGHRRTRRASMADRDAFHRVHCRHNGEETDEQSFQDALVDEASLSSSPSN